MAINKVEFGGQTLIDLTEDTVTPSTLMAGETAHDRSGAAIVGTATGGSSTLAQLTDVNLTNLSDEQIIKYNSTTQKWENVDAGGSDIVHLTKAEYDALPDTKLSDNKIYMLEDVPSSDTEDKHIILDSEDVVYPQRSFLQFTGNASIVDDETNNKTIVDIIGGSAEIVEMTQAEYDALPDTKYTDGVLRAIKDEYSPADSKLVGLGDCYSLSEKQVGCWIDGKPLYQKTIDCGLVPNDTSWHDVPHGISDIEHSYSVDAMAVSSQYDEELPVPSTRPSQNLSIIAFRRDGNIRFMNTWQTNNATRLYITIRYTKTTDTAGSGTWTPEGVPAHHYSTAEQIIGTWIDGKPLYEKTIKFPSSVTASPNVWTSTGITISNIKAIISAELFRNGTLFFASSWTIGSGTEELKFQHYYNSSLPCDTNSYVIVRYTKTTD